jgi:hypothetical protein
MKIHKISQQAFDINRLQAGLAALQNLSTVIQNVVTAASQSNNFNISQMLLTTLQEGNTSKLDRNLQVLSQAGQTIVNLIPQIRDTGLQIDLQGVITQALSGDNSQLIKTQYQISDVIRGNLKGTTV